ncbi:Checkpoint serine/threonine-protein kinase bub1 [Hypsizygus marmoreus]|uniref:Checkpoint serine/threonine-protein kinase bub1 n=1 Tax=Hypsizygus marmoreus TaxID=39966 RepID=A0A369JUX8_HYPMA|nr:Checkpoint serine/threonine-protein kinase bub1 [Hypsizygus marmoreus]
MPPRAANDAAKIEQERQKFRAQLATAINEEDDPLAVYDQFVQWTLKIYGKDDPDSGLLELLERATREFKGDPLYKTDLRYLKLWSLYAGLMKRPGAIEIYAYLLGNDIGTSYSMLYEGYAALLEADGRRQDAELIYRAGIKRRARPLERLKNRYAEFQSRSASSSTQLTPLNPPAASANASGPADVLRHNLQKSRFASTSSSASTPTASPSSTLVSIGTTREERYAHMLAPPAPGKRPEKLRFNFSLLFTEEGGEYSIQEARARRMGLLGKKWGPPPASETMRPIDFNDDDQKSMMKPRRQSYMGGEPTVTINTKEALADVFGMYNSPEKTTRVLPGSKYAPLRKIEPVTPSIMQRLALSQGNENMVQNENTKTPTPAFRPFVDENAQPRTTPGPAKFTPFVDPDSNKAFTTPRPVLSLKDSTGPTPNPRSNENVLRTVSISKPKPAPEDSHQENVFSSKVFTPAQVKPPPLAPLRDVFTDDHGKPQPKVKPLYTHERAKSQYDLLSPGSREDAVWAPAFRPFIDENARTPFKVFSRPPEPAADEDLTPKVVTPPADLKPTFKPYRDEPAFTPYIDKKSESEPPKSVQELPPLSLSKEVVEIEDSITEADEQDPDEDHDDYHDDYEDEEAHEQYETVLATDHADVGYDEGESYREIPLGGRFGQFNVMTPITERTFEYTTSTRGENTPSERLRHISQEKGGQTYESVFTPQRRDEHGAIIAAERLAAELREDENEEYDEEQPLEPFRLSADHVPQRDPAVTEIEERTGTLSLSDTLTLNSKFRPPNPCNPFDPSIMGTLLSRLPKDPHYYDFRDRESGKLDSLQKFARKTRKTSGNGNTGVLDLASCLSLELDGHRFNVSEKLGEGGFGAVFKARDMGARRGDDDSDEDLDEDDDEENASMVALKVVKPRNLWEYHVLRRLHSVLPASLRRSVILPHGLYAFRDESFLVLDYCSQGTLLNIVNGAVAAGVSQQGACLDELLVVFFTIELLRLLEACHNAGFIHGDLKIDNCLLRLEDVPGGASAWSSLYHPSGEGGWSCKGLKVIDFGRTIDTRLFPSGQQYIAEWATDDRDCFEVREDRPWTYQTDYFGLAGIIYCMLFGKYIQGSSVVAVSTDGTPRYKIGTPLKRYWQTDLWNRLFDILLNPCLVRPGGGLPVSEELGGLRGEMEVWLQGNCNRTSNTLKGLLKKVEVSCYVS